MACLKVDENLPTEAVALLRNVGHDAHTVYDRFLGGASDQHIAMVCQAEGRAIVTLDLDFADIRSYPPEDYPGIIVLRPPHQDKQHVLALMAHVVPLLETEPLLGKLWIISMYSVRIRG